MMMVFFSGLSSAFGHVLQSNVIFLYILILVPSAIIGASIGVKINQRFRSDGLVVLLRTVLFLLGVYLISQTIVYRVLPWKSKFITQTIYIVLQATMLN